MIRASRKTREYRPMITTTIPFAKLRLSDANVRKSASNAETGLDALAASIAEHGLLQPLIVSPSQSKKTLFEVHAGGRRLRALTLLVDAGKLPKDHPVEVRLCDDEDAAARELSLAENLLREAMTPADECAAYRDIIAQGATAEDVARRFGVTVRHVQGRLRLADLAEPIFTALAEGTITLDVAMAYGSTSDHARQLAAWERLSGNWQSDNPQAIRRTIADEGLAASDPIALFVGEAEYTGAGGRIERDLFAGEGEGTWLDADLARELATRKLQFEAEVAALGTKLGWIKPLLLTHVPYSESQALRSYWPQRQEPSPEAQARMDEIQARLDDLGDEMETVDDDRHDALNAEYETLSAEYDALAKTPAVIPDQDRPNVGTFLLIGRDGQARLASEYYTTAKAKPTSVSDGSTQTRGDDDETGQGSPTDALPRSLEEQMAKDRRDVLALHVASDPALALDLAIFELARDHAGHIGYNDTGCTIRTGDRNEPAGLSSIPHSLAQEQIEAVRSGLDGGWASESDSFTSFLAFRALDEETKAGWLAYAVSQSLVASLASGNHRNAFQTSLGAHIGIDVARHWRPGAERFFDRLKKTQILGVLGQIDPAMSSRYEGARKSELAGAATKLCAGDTIVEPAIKQQALAWVPDQMAFASPSADNVNAQPESPVGVDARDDEPETAEDDTELETDPDAGSLLQDDEVELAEAA